MAGFLPMFTSPEGKSVLMKDYQAVGDRWISHMLHGEEYNAFEDGGLWRKTLPPGIYKVVLTSRQSPGSASVYLNHSKP